MSLFKRMLSSVGIGSAKVDTVLTHEQFIPGETMEAVVHITAGKVEQTIDAIYFSINCIYIKEHDEGESTHTAVLVDYKLGEKIHLSPGQKEEIPVHLDLPFDVPLSIGKSKVWVQTGLDIKSAVDPGDRDYVQIVPDALLAGLLDGMHDLGFNLHEAECEAVPPSYDNPRPFVQEFEFKALGGDFRGRLDEVEMICLHRGDHIDVLMEIDRRARGFSGLFSEMLGTDETRIRFTVTEAELPNLTNILYDVIDEYS